MDQLQLLRHAVAAWQVAVATHDTTDELLQRVLDERAALLHACAAPESSIPRGPGIDMLAAARRVVLETARSAQYQESKVGFSIAQSSFSSRETLASPTSRELPLRDEPSPLHSEAAQWTTSSYDIVRALLAERSAQPTVQPGSTSADNDALLAPSHVERCIMHAVPVAVCRHMHAFAARVPEPASVVEEEITTTNSPLQCDSSNNSYLHTGACSLMQTYGGATAPVKSDAFRYRFQTESSAMASPQCNAAASERAAATAASSACASLEEHTVSSERTCAAAALFPPDSPWPWQSQETLPLMHSFLQSRARGGKPEIETAPPECTTPPRNAASVANRDWLSPRLVAGTTPLQIYPPSSPLLVAQAITRVAVGGSADEAEVYMPSPDEPESRPPNGASEALEAPSALGTKRADSKSDRSQQPDKAGIPQSQHEKSAHQSSSMRTTSRGPGHAEAQTRLSKMKQLRDESREQARRLRAVSAAKRPPIAADIVTATCTAIAATGDPVNVLARSEECLTTSARPAPDEKKARILRGNSSEREIHHRRAPLRPQNLQSIENSNTKDLIQLRYPGPSDDEDEQKKRAAAEQLRRRASERARIAKEALALAAARESREAAEKQARKWAERDRKLARFMAHRRAADALIGSGETGMSTFDPLLHHDTANMTLLQRSVPRTAQPQQGSDGAAHADAPHARDAPKTSRVGLKEPGLANGSCSLPPTAPLLVDRVLRHMHAASARNRSLNATFDPDCMLDELGSTPLGLPALPDSPHHRAQQRHAAAAARTSGAGLLAAQLLRQPPPSSVGVQNTHNFRASGTEEGTPHSPQPHTDDAVQFTLAAVAEGFKGTSFQKPEPDVSYRSAQLTDDVITAPTDSFGLYEAPGTRLPGTVTLTVHDSVAHSPASPPTPASAPASAPLAAADTPWSPDVLPSDSILLPTDLHDVDTMGYDLGYKGAASRSVLLDWDAKEMEMHSRTETLHDEPRDLWQAPHDIFRSNIAAFPKEGAGPSGYFVRAYGGGFQSGPAPPASSSVARGSGRNSSQAAPLDISLTMLLPQDAAT